MTGMQELKQQRMRLAGDGRVRRLLCNSRVCFCDSCALFPDKALRSLGRKVYLHIYLPISLCLSRSSSHPLSSPGTSFTTQHSKCLRSASSSEAGFIFSARRGKIDSVYLHFQTSADGRHVDVLAFVKSCRFAFQRV